MAKRAHPSSIAQNDGNGWPEAKQLSQEDSFLQNSGERMFVKRLKPCYVQNLAIFSAKSSTRS
jgi:hypothetical protein